MASSTEMSGGLPTGRPKKPTATRRVWPRSPPPCLAYDGPGGSGDVPRPHNFLPATDGAAIYSPPRARYLVSRYSSSPWREPSRPMPDCFTPPKGATSVEINPVLMPTMPYSS